MIANLMRLKDTLRYSTSRNVVPRNLKHWSVPRPHCFSSQCMETKRRSRNESMIPGEIYHGFRVNSITHIKEYDINAIKLVHEKTGAMYLHLDADDSNNVFSVAFRTPPTDSTGVPHILEHTVLCGSQRYPVRDPFFNMMKRSLNTFMNAMTASDHTMYPFSTINGQDYKNLLSVYLDAVFFPNLDKFDFLQEGHRLELENPNDPHSNLVFKGVVYNEMKGVFADNSNLFWTKQQQLLHEGTSYEHVSGGIPEDITNLTWKELKDFHNKHYHPSNSLFYSYGNLPLQNHLEQIEKDVLSRFDFNRDSSLITIKEADALTSTTTHQLQCAPDAMTGDPLKQTRLSTSILLPAATYFDSTLYRVLSHLLFNGPTAPMYQSLIESGLATEFSAGCGFDDSTSTPSFTVGVQGIAQDNVEEILNVIDETFKNVALHGFDKRRVDAILHQVEIQQKTKVANFGMNLLHPVNVAWCHRNDPILALEVNSHLQRLHSELEAGPYLEEKIKEMFILNPHRTVLSMSPNPNFVANQEQRSQEKLEKLRKELTPEEVPQLVLQSKELTERQALSVDPSCLPTLKKSDISIHSNRDPCEYGSIDGIPLHSTSLHTNGLVYFRSLFDTSKLPSDLKPYLNIFSLVFGQLGAGKNDQRELSVALETYTGGISCSATAFNDIHKDNHVSETLMVRASCLSRNVPNTFSILESIVNESRYDNIDHLSNLIAAAASSVSSSISSSGHSYAKSHASAALNEAHFLKDSYTGLSQVKLLNEIVLGGREACQQVAHKLRSIAEHVLCKKSLLRLSLVTDEASRNTAEASARHFTSNLSNEEPTILTDATSLISSMRKNRQSFLAMPLTVNFVAQCLPSPSFQHRDSIPITILSQILSSCYLHKHVREMGGAYGCFAGANDSVFSMLSYFDPHTTTTLDAYSAGLQWAREGKFTDRDIDEALLSVFSNIDAPVPPSEKGIGEYLVGITDEMRQQRRELFLATSRKELIEAANTHWNENVLKNSAISIVGSVENSSKFENIKEWTIIQD